MIIQRGGFYIRLSVWYLEKNSFLNIPNLLIRMHLLFITALYTFLFIYKLTESTFIKFFI